ncbi:hypothetical protein [Actinospongicola halichondriae]|uniref:hypothetical protein n=1 Tax=Actinospongicola halichondriae TaxID=3236844 RepID=UPI003D43CEBB
MADLADRTRAVLEGDLRPGESILAATQAQLDGGTMRLASRIGGGVAGGALGAAIAASVDSADDLEQRLTNGLVLAVTEQRVVLLDVTAVAARPKSVVLSLERDRVTAVVAGDKRVMLVKLPTIALTLDGDDEQVLRFEVPKTSRRDATSVVDALGG